MITVSSAQPSAPQSVFGLSQRGSDPDGSLIVGCIARGFSPAESLSFKWTDHNGKQVNDFVQYPAMGQTPNYIKISHLRVNESDLDPSKPYKCEATNTAGKKEASVIQASKKLAKVVDTLTLTLKPPAQRDFFLFNNPQVTLQAVISGSDSKAVKDSSVSCTMDNDVISLKNVRNDISQIIYNVTVNKQKWLDGKTVTCTTGDKNIKQEINFNEGDTPSIVIFKQSIDNEAHVSLVCEVTSANLGDVYIMWRVGNETYKEAPVSAPIQLEAFTSVLSIFKVSQEEYKKSVSCAVVHVKLKEGERPEMASTSPSEPPEPETGFALNCNENILEEDEFRSLWSTATSFIFLFLFSLIYSALLSLSKMKQ